MPTIFILFGYRFLFYSNDHTPMHVHVIKGGAKAKFNLFPVELVVNQGFKPKFLRHFANLAGEVKTAVNDYITAVKEGTFPNTEESY